MALSFPKGFSENLEKEYGLSKGQSVCTTASRQSVHVQLVLGVSVTASMECHAKEQRAKVLQWCKFGIVPAMTEVLMLAYTN